MGASEESKKSFRREVEALAAKIGVPPSRLLGREPALVTTYEYEGDRLVRSVTVREREFTEDDLAALLDRARPRGEHGHPLDEAMSPDADPSSWDSKYRYVVLPPSADYASKALAQAKKSYAEKYPDADLSSLRWRVERVELEDPDSPS